MEAVSRPRRLVYITTHGVSTLGLMRGQLAIMQERGFEVFVIASPGPELAAVAERERIKVIGVPMEREINLWRDLQSLVLLCFHLLRLRPEIVNAGTPKAGLLGMLAAFLTRVPARLYTLRGLRLETTRGLKGAVLSATERIAAWCAHRVICVSHSLRAAYLQRRLCSASKCIVLGSGSSNGVNVARFQLNEHDYQTSRQHRIAAGIPDEAPVIGFVGRLVKDKGIEELYQAFQTLKPRHPGLRLVLVGDFETGDPVSPDVVQQIRNDTHVIITGFVPSAEHYYPWFHVLAFPSYREGFPNVPLEAAAAGLPVIGFIATGTVDAVLHGVTGALVPCGNATALAQELDHYLRDDILRTKHGEAGKARVEQEFRNETIWNALARLYCSLQISVTRRIPFDEVTYAERYHLPDRRPGSVYQRFGKRGLDILLTLPACLLMLPLCLLTALLIKLESRGPVFFVQERLGRYGQVFRTYKFRTMTDLQRTTHSEVLPGNSEVTRVGHWLRRFKIDELPQLWNVLGGDMSLIGPRPALPDAIEEYDTNGLTRLLERPGLTGLAQVHGNIYLTWPQRWVYDAQYVSKISLLSDFGIFIKTLLVIIFGEGRFLTLPKSNTEPQNTSPIESSADPFRKSA